MLRYHRLLDKVDKRRDGRVLDAALSATSLDERALRTPKLLEAQSKALYAAAKKVGADAEFVSYPNTNHGFGQNFGTPSADDAFKRALAFLNKNLKGE